jgi:hypothetical protein
MIETVESIDAQIKVLEAKKQELIKPVKTVESINSQIRALEAKKQELIKPIDDQIKELRNELQKQKIELLCQQYPIIYAIEATPSRSDHSRHIVCYMTTEDKAKIAIGNNKSYDPEDDCTWCYTIKPIQSNSVDNFTIQNLDKLPDYFPYRGWLIFIFN